jgi:hypothetical protein
MYGLSTEKVRYVYVILLIFLITDINAWKCVSFCVCPLAIPKTENHGMVLGTATGVYKNVGFYMKYYSRPKLHAE